MTVNPQAQTILDAAAKAEAAGVPTPQELGAEELRALFKNTRGALTPEAPDVGHVEDLLLPGPAGHIPVRYYRPEGAYENAKLPMLLYFHGGGWMVGDIETHDVICRMLANRGGFAVANVDYRLAPENKFPAAIEDSWAVTQWALAGAGGLSIDTEHIGVGGDSAGGNISAVLALMARDARLSLAFQALIYPATHFSLETRSHHKFAEGYLLTRDAQTWYHESYLRSDADRENWWASPALASDFENVAPAFVLTCGYDPLVDEGRAYADLLKAAGVPVAYRCFEGQVHGFITMGKVIDEANEAVIDVADRVAAAF
ncbi:MAG: alpha/beta hydrolase, partial [Rhodospirillales bacterium]|nr:alpha/beta hydrolase [Rhodospirillales bacterium]